MKKILGAAVLMAAGAAMAATTIQSSNTFGFVPVTGATGLKAVAVPVVGYGAGDIKIAEVLQTTGLAEGDKLYTLGSDGKYNEYVLQSDKTWKASRIVTVGPSGMTAASGTPADEATLKRSQAFWLDTKATQVNILGQAQSDVDAVIWITDGWQMIGNPSMTTPFKVSTLTTPRSGSRLNVGANAYQKGKNGSWLKLPDYDTINDDDDVIPVGAGAMLLCK